MNAEHSVLLLLGRQTDHMFDHISNTIENEVIVIICLPHEGRSADHFVLLIHIGFVQKKKKVKANKKTNSSGVTIMRNRL